MVWIKEGERFTQRYYDWCKAQPKEANVIARFDVTVRGPFGEMPFPDAFVDELERLGVHFEHYSLIILTGFGSTITTGFSNSFTG